MTIPTSPDLINSLATKSGDQFDATPLVVDLDGTLIATDMLLESAIRLIRKNPLYVFLIFVWLLQGKRQLKMEIARRVDIPCALLPYHQEFLNHLKEQSRAH
jgi:hypothetical protein